MFHTKVVYYRVQGQGAPAIMERITMLLEGTWLEKEAELTKVQGEGKKRKLAARKPLSHELDEAVLMHG